VLLCVEGGHEGGIDSKLCSVPMRVYSCDDFDAAVIKALGADVEVAQQNIAGNSSTV